MEKSMSDKDDDITDVEFVDVPTEFGHGDTVQQTNEERLLELMRPLNQQVEACQSRADILLLASGMMHLARDLFICEIGVDNAKILWDGVKFIDPVLNSLEKTDETQVH
jgi:hypothetical protein